MANNEEGTPEMDMLATLGNRLKGNRKLIFDNRVQDAIDDRSYYSDHWSIYMDIRGRHLLFTETTGEK